jgi:hypothetical protein
MKSDTTTTKSRFAREELGVSAERKPNLDRVLLDYERVRLEEIRATRMGPDRLLRQLAGHERRRFAVTLAAARLDGRRRY